MEPKGNSIELSTFLKYGLSDVIGHKTWEKDGKTLVTSLWCKICAKFKAPVQSSSFVKGNAKKAAQAFINGTNMVTKFQV